MTLIREHQWMAGTIIVQHKVNDEENLGIVKRNFQGHYSLKMKRKIEILSPLFPVFFLLFIIP